MLKQQGAEHNRTMQPDPNSCKTQLVVCANPPIYACKAQKLYGCEYAVFFGHSLFCKHKDADHYARLT